VQRALTGMNLVEFRRLPLLAILRGGDVAIVGPLIDTLVDAGLTTLEIAMNTPDAAAMIERAVEAASGRLTVGAGTVTTQARLNDALAAGASFMVMPTLVTPVVEACVRREVPVFPGALTPQEIHTAWSAGATMVKVFPAKVACPQTTWPRTSTPEPRRSLSAAACSNLSGCESRSCHASATACGP
jgi:2-dehydro-3-deoxyphosphogluconate aldolase/(4S)-4-hydroxy-2-oxoglutarate aldolase